MKAIRNILAALILAVLGCYVLWVFKSTWGLSIGVALVLLAVAIALPTELRSGVDELKHGAVVLLPVVLDAKTGARAGSECPPERDE
jgi:hypothetical protein